MEKLNAVYFDYFGYFWCNSILAVGDMSEYIDVLKEISTEFKLNLLIQEFEHDFEILPREIMIINPDFLKDSKNRELFENSYNIFEDSFIIFIKKTELTLKFRYDRVFIPESKLTIFDLRKLILIFLTNKFGKDWLSETIDEIII
jgi:hypothetical protein